MAFTIACIPDMKAVIVIMRQPQHLGFSMACMGPSADSFLLRVSGSSCRERILNPPLLVSAASDSSEADAGGRLGEIPKGRQATGKPSPDTSYKAENLSCDSSLHTCGLPILST